VIHQVPLDLDLFGRALNQGRAIAELAPRSPVRKAIRQLAQDVWQAKVA
jgi:Flp pilus assembly CpaE family ATPase